MALINSALTLTGSANCKFISVSLSYSVSIPQDVTLKVLNFQGLSILTTTNPVFTINPGDPPTNYVIPVDASLTITHGLINATLTTSLGVVISEDSLILHCDIDCCLTKLTNELLACACDCAKCASSLAKAQKIFLLLNSSEYAITQANLGLVGGHGAFLIDANSKYLKAKEICDNSCGCDC